MDRGHTRGHTLARTLLLVGTSALFLVQAQVIQAQPLPHEEVVKALSWQLPANHCRKPRPLISHPGVTANSGVYGHAPSGTTEESIGTTISDVDHYQITRFERKQARWDSCVHRYRAALLTDFERLKASASYGLTLSQAKQILTSLRQIQDALLSTAAGTQNVQEPTE